MLQTFILYLHTAACRTLHAAGTLPHGNISVRILCLLCLSFSACDVEDERDLCCERVVMEYRYLENGQDAFKENIRSLRHFLFDGQERFVREVPAGATLRLQVLEGLETGAYTMVTVGNAANATLLDIPAVGSPLNNFILHVQNSTGGNADLLYYGIRNFTLTGEDVKRERRFVTQLANVHCRLQVTVKWQNLPPVLSTDKIYRLTLESCAQNYELDGARGYALGEKRFPHSPEWEQRHLLDYSLSDFQLRGDFVSLRYTDDSLPVLRVFCLKENEYTELTPPLDLKKAFVAWGYSPSSVERQEYKIIVTIYLDGHVGIRIAAEAGVADWVDGGSFG
ncbi:MAG: FimB/Mfa2 family fimbrial subunit [Bacteroides sp.]|nr:FimB/Mfa2 family fimbrial subunit [Bacteroides sp.]